jgi:hypothetical protein
VTRIQDESLWRRQRLSRPQSPRHAAQHADAPAKAAGTVVEGRPASARVFSGDPRSLDVRSTSRWTSLVRSKARRPSWPQRRPDGLRSMMNALAGPVVARRRMPVDPSSQRKSRNRSQGCHRRRLAASTPTWSASTAWTLRVDVGDSVRLTKEPARVDGGGRPGNPPRRPVQEIVSGDALKAFDCGKARSDAVAQTGPCARDGHRRLTCGCS